MNPSVVQSQGVTPTSAASEASYAVRPQGEHRSEPAQRASHPQPRTGRPQVLLAHNNASHRFDAIDSESVSVHDAGEDEAIAFNIHRHHVLRPELAFQDQLGHRVFDALLDRALQRPRAEHRIEADLGQRRQRQR
jgi:hypothetical protein